jgi:DNA-binding NtrC family response regulator
MTTAVEPSTVLVIDDDETICELLNESLAEDGFQVESAPNAEEALIKVRQMPYDAIVTDLNLPGLKGTDVVRQALTIYPNAIIVVMTGAGSIAAAVECMKLGAYDFLSKPFDIVALTDLLKGAINERMERARRRSRSTGPLDMQAALAEAEADTTPESMIGISSGMREVFELIEIVARSNSTVLVTGETGTGKELVARELHRRSRRANQAFVGLNCAAIPETLLEDELYLGWRHPRLRGEEYYALVDEFVRAVKFRFPMALLQWEDFSKSNAFNNLARYQQALPSFNDDIQGTGAVVLAGVHLVQRLRGK